MSEVHIGGCDWAPGCDLLCCRRTCLTDCQCMGCRLARETMVHRYAPSVVADQVVQRLRDIELQSSHAAA
jgi:hypothetical protein